MVHRSQKSLTTKKKRGKIWLLIEHEAEKQKRRCFFLL